VQTLAESEGHFEHAFVAIQLEYVARSVDDGGAAFAPTDVFLDGNAQRGIDLAVEIV